MFFFNGGPYTASQVLVRMVAVRAFTLPASLIGSFASAGTASAASTTMVIAKNGSSIGTITFNASATGTFSFAAQVSFAAGDVVTVTASASADAALKNVSLSLLGTQ